MSEVWVIEVRVITLRNYIPLYHKIDLNGTSCVKNTTPLLMGTKNTTTPLL